MYAFSQRLGNRGELLQRAEQIRGALPEFYQQNYAIFEGRKVNRADLSARNDALVVLLDEFISGQR
jgi:hypothetical protein